MPFADPFVFNIARGRVNQYGSQVGTGNAALILVVLEDAGLEAIATIRDHNDLAALLAGSSNEQTTMGRKTITSATVTTDDTNDWQTSDFADPVWLAATGNATGGLLVCYDSDTTSPGDAGIIPLTGHPFAATPIGTNITVILNSLGFYRARDCA